MNTSGIERQLSRSAASSEPRRATTTMHTKATPSHTGTNQDSVCAEGVRAPHSRMGKPMPTATAEPSQTEKRERAPGMRSKRETPFFFNETPTTEIYTLSLHDALPI